MKRQIENVLPETHWVSWFVLPFLIVAWGILYIFPGRTADLFAWPIKPDLTALFIGAAYLSGAYFFYRAAVAREWSAVRAGFLPVAVFAALEGVATLLHWPKFNHTHPAFIAWAGLYFTTPWLVLLVWLRNRRVAGPEPQSPVRPVPRQLRLALGGLSILFIAAIAYLYIFPTVIIAFWPWTLSPLTARVLLGFFMITALAELCLALSWRWQSYRVIVQAQMLFLALFLLALPRAWGNLDPTRLATWIFLGVMAAFLLLDGWFYLKMEGAQPVSSLGRDRRPGTEDGETQPGG